MSKKVIAAILAVTAVLGAATIFFECQMVLRDKELLNLKNEMDVAQEKLEDANQIINDLKSDEYQLVYVGDFKVTYYCDERRNHICGGSGVTASGKPTEVGVTAAADWSVLPKGSIIYIEGVGFREIQDIGGAVNGNHIDVLVGLHSEAESMGVEDKGTWLLINKN